MDPLTVIDSLRNSDMYIKTIFTQGGCYQFYKFLSSIFPEAKPMVNSDEDHIVTLINGVMYDINGIVNEDYGWRILKSGENEKFNEWSFYKKKWLCIGECPACEEPLIIN